MSIDYSSLLTAKQKRDVIEQRIAQFALEAYQHTLTKETCAALDDEEGLKFLEKSLITLEAAITTHQAELAKLPADE
jgi:hypothetical protein